ncbi:class I SAM-dependent methyltransferase [Salinibacter ruber]|uniref:class I SAM-dependent methyltransferase n=1 Tax=Salinibacter ruber TaxID=146919 RepID=UPI002168F62D|nr:class I SAM-dependent methyltransferase [Salinibacter ruber]MCS3685483.1 hypothetical protein [Salinibacter ruber]
MGLKNKVYEKLPDKFKPVAREAYRQFISRSNGESFLHTFFDSQEEYEALRSEVENSKLRSTVDAARRRYQNIGSRAIVFGEVDFEFAEICYSITRKLKPSSIVETGVCNGVSTLYILKALDQNDSGFLYSLDYPYRVDDHLEEFGENAFEEYGSKAIRAVIPSDKDPGWIVPEELRKRWDLRLGKSQTQLPRLLDELGTVDLFIHDSEHSHPCMMFEYEAAWHRMEEGGAILSDDISKNRAFETFCRSRSPVWGTLNPNTGFILKC